MKWKIIIIGIAGIIYILSYVIFRGSNIERWSKDGKDYVIFPKSQTWLYYLYRPASYIDSKLTKMQFHIGPHHETE